MDKLQRLVTAPANAKLIQESIITERDGRYVIPIRAESKGKIPGIVHDTSASGATLFIEPIAAVEMGNRVRELEREEQHETERILRELTGLAAAHADEIDWAIETLAEIDLAFAKAKYSFEIKGVEPEFQISNPKPKIQKPTENYEFRIWNLEFRRCASSFARPGNRRSHLCAHGRQRANSHHHRTQHRR